VRQPAREHGRREGIEVRRSRESGIDRLELARGGEQEGGRIAAASQRERDLPPQEVDVRPNMIVDSRPRLGDPQEIEGIVDGARLELGLCGGQRTLRAAGGLGRQLDRALEEGGGGREATARRARAAECSSSAATCSSGMDAACARCQARRSGSTFGSVASASASWTSRRSCGSADR
jgi:hypothetical protein